VTLPAPALDEPAGWRPLATHPVGAFIAQFLGRSYVAGDPTGDRLRIRYFWRATDTQSAALVARAWFGARAEGPPGHAHGGSMASVLDEAMGLAVWLAHSPAVAAHLETDFRKPIPLGSTVTAETTVGPAEGSGKASATARLVGDDGTVYAEGSALFVLIAPRHGFTGGGA
jgi:acyl-coenzyme A thioesterase PaaI-like protein